MGLILFPTGWYQSTWQALRNLSQNVSHFNSGFYPFLAPSKEQYYVVTASFFFGYVGKRCDRSVLWKVWDRGNEYDNLHWFIYLIICCFRFRQVRFHFAHVVRNIFFFFNFWFIEPLSTVRLWISDLPAFLAWTLSHSSSAVGNHVSRLIGGHPEQVLSETIRFQRFLRR